MPWDGGPEEIPLLPGPGNPLMLFARFTPRPGAFGSRSTGNTWHGAAGSRVTPSLRRPAHPRGTPRQKAVSISATPRQLCPTPCRGPTPSCPGRRRPWTRSRDGGRATVGTGQRGGDTPRRLPCSPGVLGLAPSARGSTGSGGRPCWGLHHPPHAPGAAYNKPPLCPDKGQLVAAPRAAPGSKQSRRVGEGSPEPTGPPAQPCPAGAAEGPGRGSAVGARPGS